MVAAELPSPQLSVASNSISNTFFTDRPMSIFENSSPVIEFR